MNAGASIQIETLTQQPLPIFGDSVRRFQQMAHDSNPDLTAYGDIILKDPGLVLHTIQQLQPTSGKSSRHEISSMSQATLLLGTTRVQQLTAEPPQLERTLKGHAQAGYARAASRAFHAAFQAWDWAHIKNDHAPEEIFLAALLHDVAEMALWVAAPERIHNLRKLIFKDHLHTDEAQYIALGESLEHFSRQIAFRWHLPPLVHEALRPENASNPRIQGIMLAVQLGRAAERGWHTDKMYNTLEQIAEYLDASLDETVSHIHSNAVRAARESSFYGARPAAALLPLIPGDDHILINDEFPELASPEETAPRRPPAGDASSTNAITPESVKADPASTAAVTPGSEPGFGEVVESSSGAATAICLTPQPQIYAAAIKQLMAGKGNLQLNDIMRTTVHGLHDGAGLNRVVFAMLTPDRDKLISRFIIGADNDPAFSRFTIELDKANLFSRQLDKPVSLWINNENRDKYWRLIPQAFKSLIKTDTFFTMSVHIDNNPIGLFYADRRGPECQLDEAAYKRFRQLCQLASKSLAEISVNTQ